MEEKILSELVKPIIEYLKEKHHPHTTIEITVDGVKVKDIVDRTIQDEILEIASKLVTISNKINR